MDRRWQNCRYLAALAVLAVVLASGCNMFKMAVYLIQGTDQNAEFAGLRGKKVVVVCSSPASLTWSNASAGKQLAQQIGRLLETNDRKIIVIDQQKVATWMDENTWQQPTEVGKALGADMVLGVDLASFSILNGQTLYQGKAIVSFKVFDLKDKDRVVFEKVLPETSYPPSSGVPIGDRPEAEFRREFVGMLADQVGRHFYAHDAHADIGLDAKAGLR
jgi:hypothetical protein